jgi:hypothetical protein
MARLRGRSPFGAAKARGHIHFREHLSKNHFHENLSKKMQLQISPGPIGAQRPRFACRRKSTANSASSGLIPSHERIINPRLSLAA